MALSFKPLLALLGLCCLSLSLNACSVLHAEPNKVPTPVVSSHPIDEPDCTQGETEGSWKVSATKKQMTVAHNYQNSHESCEKKARETVKPPHAPSDTRAGSLHDFLTSSGITAKVNLVLDPTKNDRDHSSVELKAI